MREHFATLDWLARLRFLALSLVALPACSGDEPPEAGSGQMQASQTQETAPQENPSEPDAAEPVPSNQPQQETKAATHDRLSRCDTTIAVVSPSTMPAEDEERENIGMVRPSGWRTMRYDDLVDGRHLRNCCHPIGRQFTAENATEENLVIGVRYVNVKGMLPFENEVTDYVGRTEGRGPLSRRTRLHRRRARLPGRPHGGLLAR